MKTKITNLITICALAMIGLNTTAANYTDARMTAETSESLPTIEKNISLEHILSTGNSASAQFLLNNDADAVVDFQKEAQMVTKWLADKEEAKVVQKLIDEVLPVSAENVTTAENTESSFLIGDSTVDSQTEAQLVTKQIADNEEAKAIQKLVGEGKLAENK